MTENPKSSTSERWTRIERIFHAALEQSRPQRAAWLDRQCAGDAALRREVKRLLQADDDSEAFLRDPALGSGFVAPTPEDLSNAGDPTEIGSYRLTQRLGSGGMGTVWPAERHDEHFHKQVAVKLIKRGMDTAEILQRFRNERQVLAQLEHPNIARLIDGGATDDGRPYLVMEGVEGVPLNIYCDQHQAGIRERLKLFSEVCEAVQYAHQNLVVHRDLKPSNILVTEQGDPKLLDFGIARMLTPDADQALTVTGQRVFTPKYASPEQIRGEPVTTSTDVYSLGVILYELLARCGPYDDVGGEKALETAICEREPTRPSVAATTREGDVSRLRRRLVGDLDTIVLMAMGKKPERRYASAEQFGDDIQRHLAGMPVRARPDTLGYRTRKFASRHAASLTGVAIAFVALIVGVIVFGYLYRDAALARTAERVARENAESRAAEAEQTAAFFADMLGSISPGFAKGRDMTIIREVLDRASDEVTTELAEFPQAQATLRLTIGNTYRLVGDYERAAPHLDAALALNIRLHGEDSLQAADVLHKQAVLAEALGDYDGARDLFARQLLVREREGDRVGIAQVWSGQARMAYYAGDVAEMLDKAERARDVFLDELGEPDERTLKAIGLVTGAHTLLGRYTEAEKGHVRLIELWTKLEGPLHPDPIISEANLAMLLRQLRRNEEAEVKLARVVERAAQVFGEEHETTLAARTSLAQTLQALERYDEAEAQVGIAVETLRESVGEGHPDTLHASSVLGSVLRGARRFDESIAVLRKSYELHVEAMGPDAPGTNATATVLGAVLIQAGAQHWSAAEAMLTDAVERLVSLGGPESQLTKNAVTQLRRLYAPDAMDRPDKLAELDERFGDD